TRAKSNGILRQVKRARRRLAVHERRAAALSNTRSAAPRSLALQPGYFLVGELRGKARCGGNGVTIVQVPRQEAKTMPVSAAPRPHVDLQNAVVRFAGDSGDGMQLTGTEFTREAALHGNDLATFPDFPAEIRAPAGTTAGVSGYQIQFAAHEVFSAGDQPDTLVAMNPAALKVHLADLKKGGLLVVNEASFTPGDLTRAGWKSNPLTDGTVEGYRVIQVDFD